MTTTDNIKAKFERLLQEGRDTMQEGGWDGKGWTRFPPKQVYQRFRTESMNIVRRTCGAQSDHYQELLRLAEGTRTALNSAYLPECYGVLEAAYRDFSEGFLFDLRALVTADLLGGFVEQAEVLLEQRYHVPAASLAGAVLEDTLRQMCELRGIPLPAKTKIDSLNALLAKDGTYNELTQKEVTAKADVRNNADHGRFDQFTEVDVKDMVAWVRRFAAEHLG